ncbi:MAG: hypothetical protein JNK64_32360 [Myxococcales bacterium]|nr:hypothetical protein [Myxococcales bacterium]
MRPLRPCAAVALVAALVAAPAAAAPPDPPPAGPPAAGPPPAAASPVDSPAAPGSPAGEPPAGEPPAITPARRAAAIALAAIPGLAVPGLGARVVGERRAARQLLALRAIGLGMMVVGGVPLLVTYGSAKLVVPGVHLSVAGSGLFLVGWWADVYAAAGGGAGAPRRRAPIELVADATWIDDEFHGGRELIGVGGRGHRGRWTLAGRVAGAHDGALAQARVDAAARVWRPDARATGSGVDVRAAIDAIRDGDDDLVTVTGELAARGRLHLGDLDRALAGSFVELDAGLGLQAVDYRAGDADLAGVLISRFAGGVFLPCARGEVAVFYDHRRDTLAGGLPAGRAAGFFGSVGATAEVAITPTWIAAAAVEFGSARLATLGVRRGLR